MLVSLLIPIYNVEKHLVKCLDSIFNQTYTEIEYIFLNDCTQDNSMQILQDYIYNHHLEVLNITILSHAKNKGIAVTRNELLAQASGDYILFIDSDDWIELNMVEEMVKATNNGKIDIVGCDFITEYANGKLLLQHEDYSDNCSENMIKLINYQISTTLWKLLIRKKLFENIQFTPEIEIGEDYIASIKLFYYATNFTYTHQYLYHYSQENEYRYSKQIAKSINDHIKAVKEIEMFFQMKECLTSRIAHEINLRKFNIKHYYLFPPLLDYQKWKTMFPESNEMWKYISYTRKEKTIYWLAAHHLFFLLKIIRIFSHNTIVSF